MAKILLMDDDPKQLHFWCNELEQAGHDVTACVSGSEAFSAFSETAFDVLITDIFVKKESSLVPDGGLSLINRIRMSEDGNIELRQRRRLPIIVLSGAYTAKRSKDLFNKLKGVGADVCLTKPVAAEEMIKTVDQLLV